MAGNIADLNLGEPAPAQDALRNFLDKQSPSKYFTKSDIIGKVAAESAVYRFAANPRHASYVYQHPEGKRKLYFGHPKAIKQLKLRVAQSESESES